MERKKNRRRVANRVKSSGVDYGARGSIYFHGGSKKNLPWKGEVPRSC